MQVIKKFPHLFPNMDMNNLVEQFMAYRVLSDTDIPISVKTDVGIQLEYPYYVDALTPDKYLVQMFPYSTYYSRLPQQFKLQITAVPVQY